MEEKSTYPESVLHDLKLRKIALGEIDGNITGYPSLDKPWLKYYKEEHIVNELPHMTAYEYLKHLNKDRLDYIAIDSIMGNYTYEELFAMIDKTAASLYEMGIVKGKKVLEMLPVLPHESFIFYGIDAVGAALCPLPPLSTIDEICNAIRKFDVELFFTFDYFLTDDMEKTIYESTNLRHIIDIGARKLTNYDERTISWDDFLQRSIDKKLPNIERKPEDLLFLANTGGSTGVPKSVMLNDDSFNIAVHQYLNSDLDYKEKDRWLRLWPIFSATAAVSNNHLPLCTGMNNILRILPMNFADFDKIILEENAEHLMLIPQLLDVLEQSNVLSGKDLSYVKTCGCGGMGITSQFEERVENFYKSHNMSCILGYGWGCTENATSAAMRSNSKTAIVGTVGAPLVKTIVSVFDPETGEEKRYDEEGELCINSYTIMMGYYNDLNLTNQVIKQHLDGSTWLHTGDLGTINKEGIVTVKGRMTRVIFTSPSSKIYPSALEEAISKVVGVQQVAICAIPNTEQKGFYAPICFVVPEKKYSYEEIYDTVKAFCTDAFPEDSRPKEIYIRGSLPLTKVGKPDIKVLEEELRNL